MIACSALIFALAGCNKKEAAPAPAPAPVVETEHEERVTPATPSTEFVEATIIFAQVGVYTPDEAKDGKLRWIGSFGKGQPVKVEVNGEGPVLYPFNFVDDKEGAKKTEMFCVDLEDNRVEKLYVVASNVIPYSIPCVMLEDSSGDNGWGYVYNEPDLKKVTSNQIPAGTIGAVHRTKDVDENFAKVTFYVEVEGEKAKYYKERYVESHLIIFNEDEVLLNRMTDRFLRLKFKEEQEEEKTAIKDELNEAKMDLYRKLGYEM